MLAGVPMLRRWACLSLIPSFFVLSVLLQNEEDAYRKIRLRVEDVQVGQLDGNSMCFSFCPKESVSEVDVSFWCSAGPQLPDQLLGTWRGGLR